MRLLVSFFFFCAENASEIFGLLSTRDDNEANHVCQGGPAGLIAVKRGDDNIRPCVSSRLVPVD